MPKRSVYLQPPDNPYRRIHRDLEFLCDYWDRLLAPNRNYDICLPELLRANHLTRHLSSFPYSNQGVRVNVSFAVLDDYLELENMYNICQLEPCNNGLYRLPCCNGGRAGYNNLLRNYVRQMSETYAAIERELIRARVIAPIFHRNRIAGYQNAFYDQCTATCNWNKSPVGNRASPARVPSELHERQRVNSRERNNHQTCASTLQHECCVADGRDCSINQQGRQKEYLSEIINTHTTQEFGDLLPKTANQQISFQNSQSFSSRAATFPKLQPNNNAPRNRAGVAFNQNDNATTEQQKSKDATNAYQDTKKVIDDAAKTRLLEIPSGELDGDVATDKGDKRSIEPVSCQERSAESSINESQSCNAERQGRGSKRELDDREDQVTVIGIDRRSRQESQSRPISGRIRPRAKGAPIFSSDEKTVGNRLRSGTERKLSSRRHVLSSPKYASFLRMLHWEVANERFRNSFPSQKNDGEKSQRRRGLSAESTGYGNRAIRDGQRIEGRTPTPRSTVHTTYNPVMRSTTATDPLLDSGGLTTQLLRLAILLYAPALMPALNSLIARQNQQQTTVPIPSSFEGSNDLLTRIFRLLNEAVSIGSDRVPSETNAESSRTRLEEGQEDAPSIATEEAASSSSQRSPFIGTSHSHARAQKTGKDRKWRLTTMTADSGVRLDRNLFASEDFRMFEEFLTPERKRPRNVRSLSTRSENTIVMKEYFRNWLHRLLQQLNTTSNVPSSSNEEIGRSEGSWRTADQSSLEETTKESRQRSTGRQIPGKSPDSSKDDDDNTEHEEEDSDEEKSFTSATSTNSSCSLQSKQDGTRKTLEKKEQKSVNKLK